MSVLVGFVPTPEGRAALDAAISEARLRATSLIVLNAASGDSLADPRHANADAMAKIDKELAAAGIAHSIEHRTGRDPVEEILEFAGRDDVELLIIGMRRRSPVGKLLMGSAAQQILLEAPGPVLAVKVG